MRRQRLRPAWSVGELAGIYGETYDHTRWGEHIYRVNATIAAGLTLAGVEPVGIIADLSCGDGSILDALPAHRKLYGDLTPGLEFTGSIDQTIEQLPDVDLYVCTETIEHLDDPGAVLQAIGAKARMLLLSTPVNAWDDGNLEHYWAWDREAVESMLTDAGFAVSFYWRAITLSYRFGIWGCTS